MRIVVKPGPDAASVQVFKVAQALLEPEKILWSFGSLALACSTALFAYELLRPNISAEANMSKHRTTVLSWDKASPFAASTNPEVLVKLPTLSAKYQNKVLYVWARKNYLGRKFTSR